MRIAIGSVTYAMKVRKLLLREGIQSRLVKVDNTADGKGCSHGMELNEGDFFSAIMIIKRNGIAYTLIN